MGLSFGCSNFFIDLSKEKQNNDRLFWKIVDYASNPEYGNPADTETGYDITIKKEKISHFRDQLIENFEKVYSRSTKSIDLYIDTIIAPSALNKNFYNWWSLHLFHQD